jgi:probable O-glycosylation ligase (exosortase A-associated)
MTYSRGAMLSLAVIVPHLLLRSRHRVKLGLVLVVFGLILVPIMAGPEIRARFLTIKDHEVDASANSRKAAWRAAWQMAVENPILGVGLRNSPVFSHEYGADSEGRVIHSQYFQIVADNGFVGLALFLLIFVTAWLSLRRCRQLASVRTDPEAHWIAAMANGVECSLGLYAFGTIFLSTETCELPWLLQLLAAQLGVVSDSREAVETNEPVSSLPLDQESC